MALHTLIIKLHTLVKYTDYQIDNMLVYAVYAKTKIRLCVVESLFRETLAATLELSAVIEESLSPYTMFCVLNLHFILSCAGFLRSGVLILRQES